MRKRTLRFDDYIKEYLNIDNRVVREFEETTKPATNLGTGSEVVSSTATAETVAPAASPAETKPAETETPEDDKVADTEETPVEDKPVDDKPLDLGDREDISLDEIKLKMDFIKKYTEGLSTIIANVEKIPLDEKTKQDITAIFSIIQNSENIDVPNNNDAIKLYFEYINSQLKAVSTLIINADKVPLDKSSKERIVGIYDIIRNIQK
jgi:uncharacterized protein YfkK (UPF0435 family)